MSHRDLFVVEGYRPTRRDDTNLKNDAWSLALDQRAWGPRKLVVAFAKRDGTFRGLAYTDRSDPPELALAACIEHLGIGSAAAIAFCDEELSYGEPPSGLATRFDEAREIAESYGVHLVDWIARDDDLFRSSHAALFPDTEWWDIPASAGRRRSRPNPPRIRRVI